MKATGLDIRGYMKRSVFIVLILFGDVLIIVRIQCITRARKNSICSRKYTIEEI